MSQSFPLITAHSGCMDAFDNTIQSVETGIRLGADIIEEDIRVTRDGVAVLAHDDTWQTVDGQVIHLSAMDYPDLQGLEVVVNSAGKSGAMHIESLEHMLELIRQSGKTANLDVKTDSAIQAAADLVYRYKMQDRVFLSGCETERAMLAQREHPGLSKLLNADANLFLTSDYTSAVGQTCRDALAASCIGINIHAQLVRKELLESAAAVGLPVYVWTVNEEKMMERFINMGVHSITTRNVDRLLRLKQLRDAQE